MVKDPMQKTKKVLETVTYPTVSPVLWLLGEPLKILSKWHKTRQCACACVCVYIYIYERFCCGRSALCGTK